MIEPMILHEDSISGNCYKIRLTASLLGLSLERRPYDILAGETRTPEFLETVNANGRVPVLQVGSHMLPESNAACWFLARDSALIPSGRWDEADVLRWMCFEQYNHEPNVATLRFWLAYIGSDNLTDLQRSQIESKRAAGSAALALMNEHLTRTDWFVGRAVTLADVALFAYTHVCEEGGAFDLGQYPAIGRWIERVHLLPGFVAMA